MKSKCANCGNVNESLNGSFFSDTFKQNVEEKVLCEKCNKEYTILHEFKTKKVKEPAKIYDIDGVELKVGDGATKLCYSDREPFTIIKICTANKIIVQEDEAKSDPDFKPEWVSGGFAGSMINQGEQKWIITPNPNGNVVELRKHKDGKWYHGGTQFAIGYRRKFYDYNF